MNSSKSKIIKNNNLVLFGIYVIFSSLIITRGIFLVFLAYKGLSVFEIAIYQSVYFISTSIVEVPTGYIGDKYGKEKSIVIGLFFSAFVSILTGLNNISFLFFVIAVGEAIGRAFISGSDRALLYEILEKNNMSEKYLSINAKMLTLQSFVTGVAVFLGGYIVTVSWEFTYYLTALSYIIAGVVIILLVKKNNTSKIVEEKEEILKFSFRGFKSNILYSKVNLFVLFFIGASFLDGMFMAYYNINQIIFNEKGIDPKWIGIFFTLAYIVSSFANLLVEPITKRFDKNKVFVFLVIIQGILIVLVSEFKSNTLILAISLILCIVPDFLYIIYDTIIQRNIKSTYRATVLSVNSLLLSFSASITYVIVGYSIENIDLSLTLFVWGILISLGGIFCSIYIRVKKI